MENLLPEHLGGHAGKTHLFPAVLEYVKNKYDIRTMIDIGCGPAGMVELAISMGIDCMGVDGDWTVKRNIGVELHDFTKGPFKIEPRELAYSCEFVEHVEERYVPNYMETFMSCKYALITYAPPGHVGHHHVNCQAEEYWIEKFADHGFWYDVGTTAEIRTIDDPTKKKKNFIKERGLFFQRRK